MQYINENHRNRLPTVRIQKVVLNNFKSVKHGEVVFDCSKQFIPYGTTSDILGIYGQNGSGKTSLIESLSILKSLMSGEKVLFPYADCISAGSDHAELEFIFDFQYPTDPIIIRKVIYSFSLSVYEDSNLVGEEAEMAEALDWLYSKQVIKKKIRVYNELIKISGDIDGNNKKLQTIIDTSSVIAPFGPMSKRRLFYTPNNDTTVKLLVNKQLAAERSKSFIFMNDTIELFSKEKDYTPYFEVLIELRWFSKKNLAVIDSKSIGTVQSNLILPLYNLHMEDPFIIRTSASNVVSEAELEHIQKVIEPIQAVLPQFIPEINIDIKILGPAMMDEGEEGKGFEIIVRRGERELPIRYESDGVRRIISILSLIIDAYNNRSTTIAIDELDSGIFEYLLGEIIQVFAESGKGQLIFTSHNLRPLEVLDKKFICFTTTNPDNRYIHMKNIGATNNLRNLYFREIQMNEQDEEIYRMTKKHNIISAMRKAGT